MERKRSYRRGYPPRRRKTLPEKIKDFLRQFIAFMFSNVGIIGLVVGYTIVGAFIFQKIEGPEADRRMEDVNRERNNTAQLLWNVTCCGINPLEEMAWRNQVSTLVLRFQKKLVDSVKKAGFDAKSTYNWSFSGAFLYSLTVITTIGYGNVTPRTEWGKICTVLYAIIGMPLFLLYLSNIGDILAKSFKWTYAKLWLCRGCPGARRRRMLRAQQVQRARRVPRVPPTNRPTDYGDDHSWTPGAHPAASRRVIPRSHEPVVGFPVQSAAHRPPHSLARSSSMRDAVRPASRAGERGRDRERERGVSPSPPRSRSRSAMTFVKDKDVQDEWPRAAQRRRLEDAWRRGPPPADESPLDDGDDEDWYSAAYGREVMDLEMGHRAATDRPRARRKRRVKHKSKAHTRRAPALRQPNFSDEESASDDSESLSSGEESEDESEETPSSVLPEGDQDVEGASDSGHDDDLDAGEVADEDTDADSSANSSESYDPQTVTVPVTLCLAIMVGYVCGGAVLFSGWENWDMLDGSYFCFISLSTIGFGDIVPGGTIYKDNIEVSFIFCSMYLMLGMALIAMCFNLMQEEVIHKMRSCIRTLRYVARCNRRRPAVT